MRLVKNSCSCVDILLTKCEKNCWTVYPHGYKNFRYNIIVGCFTEKTHIDFPTDTCINSLSIAYMYGNCIYKEQTMTTYFKC